MFNFAVVVVDDVVVDDIGVGVVGVVVTTIPASNFCLALVKPITG